MTAQLVNHADPTTREECSRSVAREVLTERETRLWRDRLAWERVQRARWAAELEAAA